MTILEQKNEATDLEQSALIQVVVKEMEKVEAVKEVTEVEAVEETQEYKGFFYNMNWGKHNIVPRAYTYGEDTYQMLSYIGESECACTTIELSLLAEKEKDLPKYKLEFCHEYSEEIIESFYFDDYRNLNHFLQNNPFYNLIIKNF